MAGGRAPTLVHAQIRASRFISGSVNSEDAKMTEWSNAALEQPCPNQREQHDFYGSRIRASELPTCPSFCRCHGTGLVPTERGEHLIAFVRRQY